MATQLQIRRGTNSQVAAFTGAVGELVVNTTNDSVHVNDGSTAGGFELARVDGSNWANITTTANIDVGTVTADGLTVDTTTLVVDASNNRVGVNTTSPSDVLHVKNSSGFLNARIEAGDSSGAAVLLQNSTTGNTASDGLFVGLDSSEEGYLWHYENKNLIFATNNAERMRIDSSGNLLVGRTSTSYSGVDLHVGDTSDSQNGIQIQTSTTGYGYVLFGDGTGADAYRGQITYKQGDDYMSMHTAGTERMRIDDSGNVGIGTTSPTDNLSVGTLGSGSNSIITIGAATTGTSSIYFGDGTGAGRFRGYFDYVHSSDHLAIGTAAAERIRIDSSGNVGIGTSNPASLLTIQDATPVFEIDSTTSSSLATLQFTSNGTVDSKITHQANTGILTIDSGRNSSWGGNIYFVTDTSTRMVINSSGNVGIGVTSPEAKLHVKDNSVLIGDAVSGYATLNFHSDTDGSARYGSIRKNYDSPFDMRIRASNSTGTAPIIFENSNNSEAMRVDASGNLLVGTATAGGQGGLTVYPNGSGTLAQVAWKRAANASANNAAAFFTGGSVVGTISVGDTSTAYNTSSDQRLKDNIVDADDAGSKVDAIQVRQFDWIADGSHQDYGMVAQELQSVAPEAVTGDADSDEMMGVDYSKLVPMLVKEIQSLRARVQQLEND